MRRPPQRPERRAPYNYAFVGTYTPNGGGIYLFRVDPITAALTQLQVIDDIRNPTWLVLNTAQTRLYAVSEIDNYQGARSGAVVSYAIDGETMQLTRVGAVSSGGTAPSMPACILRESSCSSPTTAAAALPCFRWGRTVRSARRPT